MGKGGAEHEGAHDAADGPAEAVGPPSHTEMATSIGAGRRDYFV